jgi:hypothetical protein
MEVALLPDGSVVAAGQADGELALARFDARGRIVVAYGNTPTGLLRTGQAGDGNGWAGLHATSDNRVSGVVQNGDSAYSNDAWFYRVPAGGKTATRFDAGSLPDINDVAFEPDGDAVVTGGDGLHAAGVFRLTSTSVKELTAARGPIFSAVAVIAPNTLIVSEGMYNDQFEYDNPVLRAYRDSGTRDTAFASDGETPGGRFSAEELEVDAAGRLLVIGGDKATTDIVIRRLAPRASVTPTPTPTAPGAPKGVAASDGRYEGRVRVIWDAVPGAVGYDVYRSETPSFSGAKRVAANLAAPGYVDTDVLPGRPYHYWVRSRAAGGIVGVRSAPDFGSAAVALMLGVNVIDGSTVTVGGVARPLGPAPLSTVIGVRNTLKLWLGTQVISAGAAEATASRRLSGAFARAGVLAPDFDTAYDAVFRRGGDTVTVRSTMTLQAGALNILDLVCSMVHIPEPEVLAEVADDLLTIPEIADSVARLLRFGEKPFRHATAIANNLAAIFLSSTKVELLIDITEKIGVDMAENELSPVRKFTKLVDLALKLGDIARLNGQLLSGNPIDVLFTAAVRR